MTGLVNFAPPLAQNVKLAAGKKKGLICNIFCSFSISNAKIECFFQSSGFKGPFF